MEPGGITVRWGGNERTFTNGTTIRIGRDPSCEVVVDNPNVSRVHANVSVAGATWIVSDAKSSQGTFVDGDRIDSIAIQNRVTITLGRPDLGTSLELITGDATLVAGEGAPVTGEAGTTAVATSPAPSNSGAGPQRPGGTLRSSPPAGGTVVTGDQINIECGGHTYNFEPGKERVIGRDDDCDIVSANPTVSRRHAALRHDSQGWRLDDLGSSGGMFVDGRKTNSVALQGATAVFLGDVDSGERVVLVTAGTRHVGAVQRVERAARGGKALLVVALLAVIAIVGAVVAIVAASSGSSGVSNDTLARATVYVETTGSEQAQSVTGHGSGTIIDAKRGLILTAAHVAAPNAYGQGVETDALESDLPGARTTITIRVSPGNGRAAEPKFTGEVAAVDGYADLAIVRITKTVTGTFVTPDDLKGLTSIPLGDSNAIAIGARIKLAGYPQQTESAAPTIQDGAISAFTEVDRLHSNRGWLNTDAQGGEGISGGAAFDDHGHLIGVPLQRASASAGSTSDQSERLRPVSFAKPLLDAVIRGGKYTSPYTTPLTGNERFTRLLGVTPQATEGFQASCDTNGVRSAGDTLLGIGLEYQGFTANAPQDIEIDVSDATTGADMGTLTANDHYPVTFNAKGCMTATVLLSSPLERGHAYEYNVYVGANYHLLSTGNFAIS